MSAISVRLPDSLHAMAKRVAGEDNISLNQFIASAVAEKISALTTERYLQARALKGSKASFEDVLKHAPDFEPEAFDKL